jgi:dTDP-4-dehydrorhamnose reductase
LKEHFEQIMNIFTYEIGRSDLAVIGLMEFTAMCDRTAIKNAYTDPIVTVDLATLDRTFILTNVNTHGLINSAERNLNRYEFLEIIVRFANIKFKEKDK